MKRTTDPSSTDHAHLFSPTRRGADVDQDLRRLAVSLEGTTEAPHFDRTAFKAKRIYVTLAPNGKTANFMFTPEQQEFKCMMAPEAFTPVPIAWGQRGATTAVLSRL